MYLNTICDAYEILKLQDGERHLLKFHRKLAPYKVGFSLSHPQSTFEQSVEFSNVN